MMIKKFLPLILISSATTLLFLGFMYFVGIPKTRARNFYNLAMQEEQTGTKEKALEYLNTAKEYWGEEYIMREIDRLTR